MRGSRRMGAFFTIYRILFEIYGPFHLGRHSISFNANKNRCTNVFYCLVMMTVMMNYFHFNCLHTLDWFIFSLLIELRLEFSWQFPARPFDGLAIYAKKLFTQKINYLKICS